MFRPEGVWGQYKRKLANMRFLEANITLTAADHECVRQHAVLRGGEASVAADDEEMAWGVHGNLRSRFLSVDLLPVQWQGVDMLGDLFAAMHVYYLAEDEGYAEAWAEYIRQVMPAFAYSREWGGRDVEQRRGSDAWDFSPDALQELHGAWRGWIEEHCPDDRAQFFACRKLFNRQMWRHRVMIIDGITFQENDWIMARPNPANGDLGEVREPAPGLPKYGVPCRMWFGGLKAFYSHRPNELDPETVTKVAHVEWHPTLDVPDGPYDQEIDAPVVYDRFDRSHPPLFSCSSILPLQMTALHRPFKPHVLVMLRSSWQPLAAVDCPVPWPRLQKY